MRMINGNILTKSLEERVEKTNAGIILMDKPKSYKHLEVVIPDANNNVKEGEGVYVPLASGIPVIVNEEEFFIINEREIMAIV